MFFGMWLVWILGGLGVFFFGGLLGIGDWAYFFLRSEERRVGKECQD